MKSPTTPDTHYPQHHDSHYRALQNALPEWLAHASPARRLALKGTPPRLFNHMNSAQHRKIKALNTAHWTAQNDVDRRLAHLQDASAFAEPLLKEALNSRFGLDLDVRNTFVHLYVPETIPWFPVKTGARAWSVSLLDAALHNFEAKEAEDDAYEPHSTFITTPTATGQFDALPDIQQTLSIPTFIQLCRELDIGAQYATYLDENLGLSQPVAAAVLQAKVSASQKAAIRAALHWARIHGDIGKEYVRLISGLLDGSQAMQIDGQPLRCHDLTMLGARLTGIVIFAPDLERTRQVARVVAYVPDDPEHPIKEYASTAQMAAELIRQLRSKDYQQFFSRFVDHEQRGLFFDTLNQRLSTMTWHESIPGSALPAWRETPIDNPNLQFAATPFTTELWQHLFETRLNKILNDARTIAVSTAAADQKARWALWDSFVNLASAIVQTAAFIIAPFVPVLGELMMAYMAYQLLDETFEGIVDWAEGQTTEAFEHLMGTVESLVQLGAFAAAGVIAAGEFRKVLPKEVVAFIDRFKPVERPDGQTRYWKPDLTHYQHKTVPGSRPNELGLHAQGGKHLLPIDEAHFAVSKSAGQYRIEHPTRPDAYQPLVRHNGEGAWHTELEQPLEWDTATALRRLGPAVEDFTPAQREQILTVSGYTEDGLRKMHVNQESVPPLVADSIKRFRLDRDLEQFIEQLDSEQPEQYRRADPLTQLQLLAAHERWPAGKRLRWVNEQGEIAWVSSTDPTLPLTEIRQDNLLNSDPLKTLLGSLSESEIKALLGEEFAGPTLALDVRTRTLRKQLVTLARRQRSAMFESRYRALEHPQDSLARQLANHDPQLPTSVTRELLNTASNAERQQISAGQLPERQQTLMQQASEEVRVSRAFEGLALDSVSNPDTDTLALHSLQRLPGWSGDVRIEIRDLDYEGTRLDSTGRADAPEQKILVKRADGRWQPFDDRGQELSAATDFYSSVLFALPDAERQALDIHIGQGQQLKAAIRARPVERSELRLAIDLPAINKGAPDSLRLVGTDGYRRLARTQPYTLEQRAQEVYPRHTLHEIGELVNQLRRHPAGVRAELSRLNNEFLRLAQDLHRWANDVPTHDPATGRPLTADQRQAALLNRGQIKEALQRCWRRETRGLSGYTLQIQGPVVGDLPVLNADFSHVSVLSIQGGANSAGIDAFLQHFPGLLHLDVSHMALRDLPHSLSSMRVLRQLIVRQSGIRLSPADQLTLASLPSLSLLDLQGNPLAALPDIRSLPLLRHINLSDTGITTVPAGLLDHPYLLTGRFNGNLISELPPAFFTLHADLGGGFEFAHNPLSAAMRERVKIYYARTGKHFGILAEQADIDRVIALFPDRDAHLATDLLYRLPGTLAQGRDQLTLWENEIAQLTQDLARWSADVPYSHPTTGQTLNINEIFTEQVARESFGQRLELFWRRRLSNHPEQFKAELKFIGALPELTADFGHIATLGLTGNTAITAVEPFLQRFTGLRSLHLNDFALETIPQAITRMPRLETLILDHCGVVLTPDGQAALASLRNLDVLELTHNPLTTAPDLRALPALTYIDLTDANLAAVPSGLIENPRLKTAILSSNLLTELPEAMFNLPADRIDGMDVADNPLSLATRERIKATFQTTRQDFGVWADQADIDLAIELFPALDQQDASEMIYGLPGTLEHGRVQLRHWKAELAQLTHDLNAWARNVPAHHLDTGEPLSADQLFNEYVARAEFQQTLEQFWRRRSDTSHLRDDSFESNLKFMGELPSLTADFSHVATLTLNGGRGIRGAGPFLELFPNLHCLELNRFALDSMPQAMARIPALKELRLRDCRMPLTPEGQAVLSAIHTLETLDLSENPLASTPDLSALPLMSDVRLSDTGITHLPNGFTSLEHLSNAHLGGNQITELPDAFFDLNMDFIEEIDLGNNPWSAVSRNKIKAFYGISGNDFGVLAEQADIERAQALFPALDTEDASHVIYKLPGTLQEGRVQLSRWEAEIVRLTRDLGVWADSAPPHNPKTRVPLNAIELMAQRSARQDFAQKLEQFWRERMNETPERRVETLDTQLTFIGDLPALTADFSHVSVLSLGGNDALGIPARFLECFSGLQHLELRDFALGRVPRAITAMPSLENLVLTHCGVVLDAEGQYLLASRSRLEMLELFDNPLGMIPDVASLPKLKFIDLARTGIDRVPNGLLQHPKLETAILSDNRIRELPREVFNLPMDDESSKGFDFGNNPLSSAVLEQIKIYFSQTDYDLGVLAPQEDIDQVMALYPTLDVEQASEVVYRLPGTLEDGRIELARKHAELASLISELTVWSTDIPDHPLTGMPLDGETLLQEQNKRRAFMDSLERCWRQIPTPNASSAEFGLVSNLSIMGELPVLTADFGHVLELELMSTGDIVPRLGRFLDYFPNLQAVAIRGYQLGDLPEAVFSMKSLTALSLPECRITLTRKTANALAGMDNLDSLNLSGNPLGLTPDLRNLQGLSSLNLSNTGLRDVPRGVFTHSSLTHADLSNNAITDMPVELMEADADNTADFNFSGNPFTAQSLQRIAAYFHDTGNTLGIAAVEGMPRPDDIAPNVEMES